ncbi:hypothetical protein [Phocaeicola barnesiae]|uniref:hypothetical protein n=1 Tax=Phocaeicola barnesiae TaxID=376804 RepID=UPI0025A41970|nr:hypothetical protein [Phocaeicola barnesiae]MDM8257115.1 hypothetical protein [Phocaeicola barnesiae]
MNVSETKGYRLFPISIAQHLNHKEAYTYLVLLFKSDFETGESNVLLETLSKEIGYTSETVSKYLHKAGGEFVEITPHHGTKANGSAMTKNYYKVIKPTKDFIIVNRKFLDLHFESFSLKEETDLKGFILLVKCLCLNNCNFTYYSCRKMEKLLKISKVTILKLMKQCRELKQIAYDDEKECYIIMLDCFDLGNTRYFPKGTPILYKDIYNTIALFCESKGVEAPPYDRKPIAMIAAKYTETQKDIAKIYKQTGDMEFVKRNLIGYQLAQKLPTLNEPINSLNYFVKVLLSKKYEKPPKQEPYTYSL